MEILRKYVIYMKHRVTEIVLAQRAGRAQHDQGRRAAEAKKPLSAPFCGFWKNRTIFTFCGSKFTCIFCLKSLVILNFHS